MFELLNATFEVPYLGNEFTVGHNRRVVNVHISQTAPFTIDCHICINSSVDLSSHLTKTPSVSIMSTNKGDTHRYH